MSKYEDIVQELIYLKDTLKDKGFNYKTYDCINKACSVLEKL